MQRKVDGPREGARRRKGNQTAKAASNATIQEAQLVLALKPPVPLPPARRLRIFAYDPSLQTDPEMFGVNTATVALPWERGFSSRTRR